MADDDTADQARVAKRRRVFFFAVAFAIPVAFLALLEGGLRVAGLHETQPLFIASPGQHEYRQANPEVIKRFFARPDAAPVITIETGYFLARKPADGVRIVVQGGSTAAGFPYGYGASVAGMLEQRLRRVITDRPVEVISTAMSAVNSYTLLDFADEIIAERPDAVLIYAGHNEYLGVLGVGSALSSGLSPRLTRATLWLRGFALYQLLERLLQRGPDPASIGQGAGHTLMARIAAEKAIPYRSPMYEQGVDQFGGNLQRLLAKYRRAGVPVIVSTLASNERDRPPFASGADEPDSAAAWFARGRETLAGGDSEAARGMFRNAKDRDQLRFRAPEVFNDIVRASAAASGATVADVQAAFARATDDGIIGAELMLEHVHPNLDGYFLLADTFFDALFEAGVLVSHGELPGDEQARGEIPVSEVDRLFGEYKLQRVINDWPFVEEKREPDIPEPTTDIENLAFQMYHRRIAWPQAMSLQINHYREAGNAREELRVALILADALPFAPQPQFAAGTALINAGRAAEAPRYLERAARVSPNDVNVLLALSHALILNADYTRAKQHLVRVLQLSPNNATARNALAQIERRGLN